MKVLFCFLFLFIIISTKCTEDSLLLYTKTNINTINPKGHSFLLIDPDNYLSSSEKEKINEKMQFLYNYKKIYILFIIIDKINSPKYGIRHFTNHFTVQTVDEKKLDDYVSILFSIKDRQMRITTGKNVKEIYNDKWCEQALSKIKIFLRKEKYYDAFSQLLYYFEKPIMVNLYETLINIFFFCFFIGILIIVLVIPCIKKRKEKSKVQKIQDFLKKLKSSSNTVFTGNCVICLEPFDDNKEKTPLNKVSTLPCGHKFHTECLTKWLTKENKCPLCRKKPMNDTNDEKHNGSRVIEIQRVLNPFLRNYQYNEVTLSIIPIVREESSFSFNGGSSSSYSDSNGGWSDSGGASSSW